MQSNGSLTLTETVDDTHQSAFHYGKTLPSIISAARLLRLRSGSIEEGIAH